jgi:heparan-alpha-glucosaminide N-acetyltransferase
VAGDPYLPFVQGLAVVLVMWLILFWMYRRRIFLRI